MALAGAGGGIMAAGDTRRVKPDPWGSNDPGITQSECDRLVKECEWLSPDPAYNWRWQLLIKCLMCTGFRVSELLPLQWQHVLPGALVFWPAKTKYTEPMRQDVPTALTAELWAYRQLYSKRWQGTDRIFKSRQGKGSISRQRVNQVLDQLGKTAGLGRPIHPHLFRHGYAQALAGTLVGDARAEPILQRALHHRSPNHVRRYLRATPDQFTDAVRRTFGE